MKVIIDTELFGSFHFFPYVRKRADVMSDVDDLKFRAGDWFVKMGLVCLDELLNVGFDG